MALVTIDAVGSFATTDREIEAIRWTHRDPSYGWEIRGPGNHYERVNTKAEAQARVRQLDRERRDGQG